MMNDTFAARYKAMGEKGKHRDLAWNLIAHSSFSVIDRESGLLELFPRGDISYMMDKEYRDVRI